ncbi:MAG: OB-fold nucleic acid binding domain-containing protein [Candidatus Moduliflexus flocculans]|nr:OB-fold nucleic acid binding domain-containing protein [Candidatus Moduliflexus flocculans]
MGLHRGHRAPTTARTSRVRGWVYNKRSSGKVRFLLVRDGTGLIQATAFSADKDVPSSSSSTG